MSKKILKKYVFVMFVVSVWAIVMIGCGKASNTLAEADVESQSEAQMSVESDSNGDENLEDDADTTSEVVQESEDDAAKTPNAEQESEAVDVSEISSEEAMVSLQNLLDGDSFSFEEELGRKLYECRTSQTKAVDFTGEWMRTNVIRAYEAKLIISNQDAEGFDVEGYVFWFSHSGVLEDGHAYFVTENVAVYEFYNDISETYAYLLFYIDGDVMQIYATGADADFGLGVNCFWQGEYVKGEPSYTNETVVQDNFSEETLAQIHELIGDERYESMFITTLECGTLLRENCVLENGTKATYYHSWIYGIACYNIFTLLIDENGEIYIRIGPDSEFFSTVEGVTELPEYEIE